MVGRFDGHQWGENMATSGEKRWPRMGRNRWPLTPPLSKRGITHDLPPSPCSAEREGQAGLGAAWLGVVEGGLATPSLILRSGICVALCECVSGRRPALATRPVGWVAQAAVPAVVGTCPTEHARPADGRPDRPGPCQSTAASCPRLGGAGRRAGGSDSTVAHAVARLSLHPESCLFAAGL
jgi:hypothetical protein